MLSPDERQAARQHAEHCSAMLKDDEREQCLQRAYDTIDMLREKFGDDETAFNVAKYVSLVMVVIGSTPAVRLADLLDGSVAAYSFAAGKLAGVYELPERKVEEPQPKGSAPTLAPEWQERADEASQSSSVGPYL